MYQKLKVWCADITITTLLQVTGVYPLPDVRLTLGQYSLGQEDTRVTLAPASYTVTVTAAVQRATLRPGTR